MPEIVVADAASQHAEVAVAVADVVVADEVAPDAVNDQRKSIQKKHILPDRSLLVHLNVLRITSRWSLSVMFTTT